MDQLTELKHKVKIKAAKKILASEKYNVKKNHEVYWC